MTIAKPPIRCEPFLVATQNPIEQEGTYPLPEAQVDRFMLKVVVQYPSKAEERQILDLMATSAPLPSVNPVLDPAHILEAAPRRRHHLRRRQGQDYIVEIVWATREPEAYKLDLRPFIRYGASPRDHCPTLAARRVRVPRRSRLRHAAGREEHRHGRAPPPCRRQLRGGGREHAQRGHRGPHLRHDPRSVSLSAEQTREILEKVRHIEIRTARLARETFAGQYHSVFKGRGMDFEEVREDVPGDEVRAIDWNVTARTGKLFVKKFREERELTIVLLVDLSASGHFGSVLQSKRELAAEVASVLAFAAIRNNDKVGLILFTDEVEQYVPPRKGRSHVLRVVREILFFAAGDAAPTSCARSSMRTTCSSDAPWSSCCPISWCPASRSARPRGAGSAAATNTLRRTLEITGRRHDLVGVVVKDPRETELPDVGRVVLEDAESGEQFEVDTHDASVRQRFAEGAQARRSNVLQTLRGAGIDTLELSTALPYLSALRRFFQRRAARLG